MSPLVEVVDLCKHFAVGAGATVHAVEGVSLQVGRGETLAVVGESGCGKSTLAHTMIRLHDPTSGQVVLDGEDISNLGNRALRAHRRKMQIIFQDPFASLNPRMRVEQIIGEAPLFHGLTDRAGLAAYVDDVMTRVGLDPALKKRYPHQFSGGQRQRIGIARALAVKPRFLVCDEAIAALDVSIQAQVLNLFMDLREEFDLTYLFISHDLSVVEHIADRVVIMYLGRVVESAPTEALFAAPQHPYTQALLSEVPRLDQRKRAFTPVKGEIPSPLDPPSGCHFHPRCRDVMDICRVTKPMLREHGGGRICACHLGSD